MRVQISSFRPLTAASLLWSAAIGVACDSGEAETSAGEAVSDTAAVSAPVSADFLAMLPDGEAKRQFIIDCTNCHVFDSSTVTADGQVRDREAWVEAVERMLGYAGADTDFPVMTPGRTAAATADWLVSHVQRVPTRASAPRAMPDAAAVDEFLLPMAEELPHDLAVLPDGRILVTGTASHQMWLLDPDDGTWSTESIPVQEANPRAVDLTPGTDGATDWWVLLGNPHQLAHRDGGTGEWRTFDVGFYGHSVAPDQLGRVWFNSHFTTDPGVTGYVDPRTGDIRTFEIPASADFAHGRTPIPYGLRIAPDGTAWGTELRGNRIVRVDPGTGDVTAWDMPLAVSGPRRPDFDERGRFWIPEYAGGALTRFDPDTETFERYPLPVADAAPYVVRVDRERDRVWVGTATADAAFAFDPTTEEFTLYPLPSRGALVRHMDIDERTGDVWLAYGAAPGIPARIARVRP